MGRQLHKAARNANDNTVISVSIIVSYVRRWERDKIAPTERYRLYYCAALGITPEQFGTDAAPSLRELTSSGLDAMRVELGLQLAALRREAGLTQHGLAALISFSRSTVSTAEVAIEGVRPAPEFWQACDKALNTGGVLAVGAEQIRQAAKAAELAVARAAQEAREARAMAIFAAAREKSEVLAGVSDLRPCPNCGCQVAIVTTLIPADTGEETARAGHAAGTRETREKMMIGASA